MHGDDYCRSTVVIWVTELQAPLAVLALLLIYSLCSSIDVRCDCKYKTHRAVDLLKCTEVIIAGRLWSYESQSCGISTVVARCWEVGVLDCCEWGVKITIVVMPIIFTPRSLKHVWRRWRQRSRVHCWGTAGSVKQYSDSCSFMLMTARRLQSFSLE